MDLPLSSWCELVHFQRLNFALSIETNLHASVELCRPRSGQLSHAISAARLRRLTRSPLSRLSEKRRTRLAWSEALARPTVVIVVDDNAGILKSVSRLLARHGIESRTFASAEALLESDSVQTATACCSTSTSREFRESSCGAGLRHRDRSALSSS